MKTFEIVHSVLSAILVTMLCVMLGDVTKFVIEYDVPVSSVVALYSMVLLMFGFVLSMSAFEWED